MTTVQQFEPQATTVVAAPGGVEREFTVKSRSQRQQIIRRFLHNKIAMSAVVVYTAILLVAFVGPQFYQWSYFDLDPAALSKAPGTAGHPLGTQDIGRDLFAMLMRGVQRSTYIAVIFVLLAGTLGVLIGSFAGYFGRIVDNLLMRLVDLVLTIPLLVVIIVVASNFPSARTAFGVAVLIAAFGWMDLARIVRSQFLSLREREFVEAAHALGAPNRRIIFKHLIPNSLGSIIVWATLGAATSVIIEASLTYLGFGVQGDDTSLGRLVSDGVSAADTRPWLFYIPGLVLMTIVMAINLIGDGVRDAFDPSHTRVRA
jgi:ABC-type dipeptide/oligopeptide/nickel transport system permease subunit